MKIIKRVQSAAGPCYKTISKITTYIINSLLLQNIVPCTNVDEDLKEILNRDDRALKRTQSQPSIFDAILCLQARHSTPCLQSPQSPT